MARPVSWLPRVESIRRTVSGSTRSHYDRRDLEKLFEVQPRTAQGLLGLLPSYRMGPTLLVPRDDLLSFLQLLAEANPEERAATLSRLQERGRPKRVRTALTTFNRAEYSNGLDQIPNVQLARGVLHVHFKTMGELAESLMLIADEMQNNFEQFAHRYEPEPPPPSNIEELKRAEERADAAYFTAFIAEFDRAQEREKQRKIKDTEARNMTTATVDITPAEQARRKEEVDHARHIVESEGLKLPAFALAQADRYISGEIEQPEFLASL